MVDGSFQIHGLRAGASLHYLCFQQGRHFLSCLLQLATHPPPSSGCSAELWPAGSSSSGESLRWRQGRAAAATFLIPSQLPAWSEAIKLLITFAEAKSSHSSCSLAFVTQKWGQSCRRQAWLRPPFSFCRGLQKTPTTATSMMLTMAMAMAKAMMVTTAMTMTVDI